MWGLLLSIATIAVSMATKSESDQGDKASTVSTVESKFSRTFLSGICLGVGLNLLLSTIFKQCRVVERFRLYLTKSWSLKEGSPWRLPHNLLEMDTNEMNRKQSWRTLTECEFGSIRILVSSRAAATSSLQMALVTIKPGCEMCTARSAGVEVYHVLSGSGRVSQQGVNVTSEITMGQLWLVDPGCVRWISNGSKIDTFRSTADLVLLRTVDVSTCSAYARPDSPLNRIAMDPARRSLSVLEQFTASVKYMSRVANDICKSNSDSKTDFNN